MIMSLGSSSMYKQSVEISLKFNSGKNQSLAALSFIDKIQPFIGLLRI